MSYINDALRRLQKEKGSPYEAYSHLLGSSGKKPQRQYSKWLSLVGILIVLCFAAGMILFLNSLGVNRVRPVSYEVAFKPQPHVIAKPAPVKTQTVARPKALPRRGDASAVYAEALQNHREGKIAQAKRLYEKAVSIDYQNVQALNNLGVIYMGQKDYNKAVKYLSRALSVDTRYVDAHYNLACVYARKKDKDRSLFYLKNAVLFDPRAKEWAREDSDLKFLHNLPEFINLTKEQGQIP
ncbi:MAG: tetratricopeptide repeat protein [Syntrophaceae bacterium]|nr:tetratricopeptide repeat protein [Syntrophaceae bacterium]